MPHSNCHPHPARPAIARTIRLSFTALLAGTCALAHAQSGTVSPEAVGAIPQTGPRAVDPSRTTVIDNMADASSSAGFIRSGPSGPRDEAPDSSNAQPRRGTANPTQDNGNNRDTGGGVGSTTRSNGNNDTATRRLPQGATSDKGRQPGVGSDTFGTPGTGTGGASGGTNARTAPSGGTTGSMGNSGTQGTTMGGSSR